MGITEILALLAGVAMFLFGMSLMGDGLKKVAGNRLELILYRLTSTPLKGILLGTGVTAVIQSSSATSVMVVGFVNSGMMKVKQAIGIIMGAIIGTSITGWIICLSNVNGNTQEQFSVSDIIIAVTAIVGIILLLFTQKESNHHLAYVLLGFSVLMVGMGMMTGAVSPLKDNPEFKNMLMHFSSPIVGILIGIIFTSIIQSASAAVGILQALAATGAIDFDIALPIIMGIAIGASVPVLLSALGANVNGKRTAFIYLMVDTLGVIIFSILFYGVNAFVKFSFMDMTMDMVSIALLNTVFRAIIVVLLTPFIGLMEKTVKKLIKDKSGTEVQLSDVDRLEERFLVHPALAIEQARVTLNTMAELSKTNLNDALVLFDNYTTTGFKKVSDLEDIIDKYEDKVGSYVVRIMRNELTHEQNKAVSKYLHSITDLERISDHAENLAESAREISDKKIQFTPVAQEEVNTLIKVTREIIEVTVKALTEDDMESAYKIEPLEEIIDYLCDEYKLLHIERVNKNICQYQHGYVFNDMLTVFERIGDHCSNIGIALKMDYDETVMEHGIRSRGDLEKEHNFKKYYKEYLKKFNIKE